MSMPFSPETTAPGAPETDPASTPVPSFGFVIIWSSSQPWRAGEIGFLPSFARRYIGRGDEKIEDFEKFVHFGQHRPGQVPVETSSDGFLGGKTISKWQLEVYATAVAIEMKQVGRCETFVNGEKRDRATLQVGDIVLLRNEVLLLVVRRSKVLPMPAGMTTLHPYGRPDAMGMVGEGPEAWQLRVHIVAAAADDENLLIQGESGSGKELAARAVHLASRRAKGPYIEFNVANFTLSLLESELFGNIAGYPNPTTPARKGLLASAHGGSFLLDEIGECAPEVQAALLRALALGSYTPVGESIARRVDVRAIGATHRDDTYFRLDFRGRFLQSIWVPPLRERREDIPLLIAHLLWEIARKKQTEAETKAFVQRFFVTGPAGEVVPRVSWRLVEYLVRHPLPKNVRDLHTILIEAVNASTGNEIMLPPSRRMEPSLLPPPKAPPQASRDRAERAAVSKEELVACLESEKWNISRVGKRLGVHRNAVYRLMESYGVRKGGAKG